MTSTSALPPATTASDDRVTSMHVHVVFDPDGPTFTLKGDGVVDNTIVVTAHLAEIELTAKVAEHVTDKKTIGFPLSPIQWVQVANDFAQPIPTPPVFIEGAGTSVDKYVVFDRRGSSQATFQFLVSVIYGTELYGSKDPTVLNKDPDLLRKRG
jgi:hypothetical protein